MNVNDLRNNGAVQSVAQQPAGAMQPFQQNQMMPMQLESMATALAAQAKAAVEARYIMAMNRPRDWTVVRTNLLKECSRPSFANNKSTFYKKPIGAGIEGLGIRFVEAALRCMTNVLVENAMVYEDDLKELHRVTVTELESNLTFPMDVRVSRTVERSKPLDDGSFISVRKNSWGNDVFTVPATDDDLLNKRGALISKAIRTLGLRIIPGDLQEEAEEMIKKVRLDKAAEDPDAESKRIVDAFSKIKVPIGQLIKFLGHSISECSPAELVDLRGIYGAIKDGETTWAAIMESKDENTTGEDEIKSPNGSETFNPKIHIAPDRTNADGSFTKRRGAAKAADKKPANNDPLAPCITSMESATNLDELNEAREIGNSPEVSKIQGANAVLNGIYSKQMARIETQDSGGFDNIE